MKTKIRCSCRIISSLIKRGGTFAILASVLVLFPMIAYGLAVDLAWDANTESDLAGYNIYYGTASGNYSHSIDVGNITEYTLTDLDEGVTYYLAATAYDEDENESAYSVELVHTTSNPIIDPTHTITTSADAHGSISPSGSVTVSHGSNQTFTISADANYHVQDVLVDDAHCLAGQTNQTWQWTQRIAELTTRIRDHHNPKFVYGRAPTAPPQ